MSWDPFREMEEHMRRVFGGGFGSSSSFTSDGSGRFIQSSSFGRWIPPVEIVENDTQFIVTVELSGLKKDDMEVNVTGNRLTIKGERRAPERDASTIQHIGERGHGKFERTFILPGRVVESTIIAQFLDGELEITLEKEDAGLQKSPKQKIDIH